MMSDPIYLIESSSHKATIVANKHLISLFTLEEIASFFLNKNKKRTYYRMTHNLISIWAYYLDSRNSVVFI
jgi:hypothetical protein